ncbi:MAG: efflux RND transporter permease subunit [Hyphomicrobium sp.]
MVPLSTVVDVRESVQPNALTSFQQLNSATLQGVPFPGRTVGEVIDFLTAKSKEIFPETFTYDFQGESRQYVQEGNRLVVTFLFALIVIYLVLAAQYESFRDPLIILIALPTSIFGALLPLTFGLGTINIYTQIGLVTLIGLISKHGILMVDYANQLQIEKGLGRREAIEEAAAIRLRPILMTTAAMVIAMVPLIIASGRGRGFTLRHRHRHRLRHDDRHAVHAVRDAGRLYVHRPRAPPRCACGATQSGARSGGVGTALEPFRFSLNRGKARGPYFVVLLIGKPVPTFREAL